MPSPKPPLTHTELAHRWYREVWTKDGENTIDELMAKDCTGLMEGLEVTSRDDFKKGRRLLLEVFPDIQLNIESVVEQGDEVAIRWNAQATHKGKGLGIPPSNRKADFRGMTWLEIRNGKIQHGWDSWNLGGLIEKLK